MTEELELRFEKLARKVIDDAEEIECDLDDFKAGLKIILEEIENRLDEERDGDEDEDAPDSEDE